MNHNVVQLAQEMVAIHSLSGWSNAEGTRLVRPAIFSTTGRPLPWQHHLV